MSQLSVPHPTKTLFECFPATANVGASSASNRAVEPPPRGAPLKYNWDQFWAELAVRADLDNLPDTQAECINDMAQWFIDRGYEQPGETTLKEKLQLVYRHPRKVGK